ncbi:YicC family protein [Sulfitobacter sp. F26169L]|uniref:YicC/YloC family endoribonuclease n=1 Tax=Sulfitobacter sp. F26169L TaxID=2996015 RepID=UPI002260EDB3|nr:YicC/YloC family endoribonuclease [Sulfitobacter sp. F26169L]MCX7565494.1 YicC family protein [Sulfitobacter sp. F26169L]
MIRSMTGFAAKSGALSPHSWSWELRAVNGKGLDLRIRVPDWVPGLEAALRKALGAGVARGNVTLGLRIVREEGAGDLAVNENQLATVLAALGRIEAAAMDAGVSLAPSKATDIVTMRGVLEQAAIEDDNEALAKTLVVEFETVLADFNAMRTAEGSALATVMHNQLDQIETLTSEAAALGQTRAEQMAKTLRRNLARVMENVDGIEPDRIAAELALIAVKADITEEIDRLKAHVSAARDLLAQGGPIGRKLDFLMQEFNREANTLCAKAQNTDLIRVGLALKAVIDQLREQVQNVE